MRPAKSENVLYVNTVKKHIFNVAYADVCTYIRRVLIYGQS